MRDPLLAALAARQSCATCRHREEGGTCAALLGPRGEAVGAWVMRQPPEPCPGWARH